MKKEAVRKRGDSDQWLDSFARFQYVEYYRKRIEELEYVQKLLEALIDEIEKPEKKDKTIINQLSKTIADNSKVLAEFGYAPPLLSKIKSLMSENYSPTNKEVDEEIRRLQLQWQESTSAITLPMNNEENENTRKINESQRVF